MPKGLHLLTIDPGVRSTGWCYWQNLSIARPTPDAHGVWCAPGRLDWQRATQVVVDQCAERLMDMQTRGLRIVVEWPALWTGSAKSMASGEAGDLFKLAACIGALTREAWVVTHRRATMLPVNAWKGQLSKEIVVRRVKHQTGIAFADHEADACGMGLSLVGLL